MKVAVLSFAHEHAATYARLLHGMPGVELIIADPDGAPGDPARGRAVAAELDAPYADGWDEVFALRPEAVVVTSEVARRRELVERAAEAGAHVLVEQPMAAKEADARAMVRACEDAGVRLTLASPACFSPAFTAVREGIAAGEALGTLTTMHGSYNTPATGGAQDGGALGANAAVLLDLVDAVLGGEPAEQVYAQSNSVLSGQPGVESAALVSVRYASGAVASIDCSRILSANRSALSGPAMTFIGEKASVEFNARPRLLGGFDAATGGERWEVGGADLYAVMLGAFVAAAAGQEQGAGPDGAAGVRTLRVVEAAYASVRTGQPVDLASA
ncbi:Gfo/Idh/MocA family oxidoreductase [Streptomyces sp. NBC_00555]|uniref:Gfo/Idh/MocA family protein n=1 Tax=Streptomyces sp. NBC_00555 TaxID=2903662 RepID=UPI002250123A|nr:Gfo/Idh/MocA family oxidoreductase [Streptomyces sp. NBC_00555]MCX5011265.1 Gfo/Idh/MocA family oxidoreductase [Streptomyces sp. NBC_00555]